ncbi:hypothetical protein [Sphingomonas lenta]|uniref:Uncharacterized protein n=1 Tax=Sphingomonas lenta TaxID=1141887 RepID=A0A2A2SAU1_9SPHN|nr:hypothetical protein [Sphingomonas lenta]PAX06369.1 hypothetical protein CKY28_17345 [Sphingomonas lenta]
MPSRYENLRNAVARLAAPAEQQVAYLDRIHAPLADGASAIGYGNDELALELDDYFSPACDMIFYGELSEAERTAILPLSKLLGKLGGQEHADFWRREALFNDPRWAEVRSHAAQALEHLPDEPRAFGRFA